MATFISQLLALDPQQQAFAITIVSLLLVALALYLAIILVRRGRWR